ncbi:hypothetical protein [Leisingera sp. D0M16]|uniref:hypothetical protein n=1 Tax=Leisingera coralii TaxID=3351347 RepID=UPI003BA121C3
MVTAFADLGLNDGEIARYFGVPPSLILQLRQAGRPDRMAVFGGGSALDAWHPSDPPATPSLCVSLTRLAASARQALRRLPW